MLTANLVKDVWTSVTEGLKADLDSRRKTDPGGSAPDPGDSAPDQSHKCADEVSFMPPNVNAMSEATIRKYQDQAHVMIDQSGHAPCGDERWESDGGDAAGCHQ